MKNRTLQAIAHPTLWVSDILTAQYLAGFFFVNGFKTISSNISAGEHYILVEPGTPEADIRGIVWKIQAAGRECLIFWTNEYFLDQLAKDSFTATKLTAEIFDRARTYTEWAAINDQNKLTIREAVDIARTAIALLPESQKLVELAQLQKRSGQSSWDWGQIVKSLEKEFAEELCRRQSEAQEQQSTQVQNSNSVGNVNVNVDNGVLATPVVDNETVDKYSIESIVNTVNAILTTSSNSLSERKQLDQLYLDISARQKLDRKVFERIVATERLCVSELEKEEKARLRELLDAGDASIDWTSVLPAPLARNILHDAAVRNIDPVVIWQTLLATVASLMGVRINLDVESHKIPALVWTATVLDTGGGKSRADDLVLEPLREMQAQEMHRYSEAMEQYKIAHREWEKSKCEGDEPKPPTLRKYLFDIATIQAVVKRCAENGANGALWGRDELDGLFKSLGQFSKGSDESLQILLKLWNGGAISSDRVAIADSFYAENSALSLTGGIQTGVFRRLFEDAEDCNGLQARFNFAVPRRMRQKRVKGGCQLTEHLPLLYSWLNNLESTTVKLSHEADDFYSKIIDLAEDDYEKATNPAVKAWLAKWATQTMRISLILHAMECFYSQRSLSSPLQKETLERAFSISQYYRNSFEFLQEKVSIKDEISTILLQIIDRARNTPAGISLRDTYRAMRRSIEPLAKEAGVNMTFFTEQLFLKAEAEGYCQVIRNGRTVKLIACIGENKITPPVDVDNGDNNSKLPCCQDINCQHEVLPIATVNGDISIDYGEIHNTESNDLPIESSFNPSDVANSSFKGFGKQSNIRKAKE